MLDYSKLFSGLVPTFSERTKTVMAGGAIAAIVGFKLFSFYDDRKIADETAALPDAQRTACEAGKPATKTGAAFRCPSGVVVAMPSQAVDVFERK